MTPRTLHWSSRKKRKTTRWRRKCWRCSTSPSTGSSTPDGAPGASAALSWRDAAKTGGAARSRTAAYSDADSGGDKTHQRSVSAGGHHERCAAVKTASEGLRIQSLAKDMGISCEMNLHLDASATICLVSRRGLGKTKHVDMQNLWIQEASKAGRFVAKKVGTNANPADLMTKPLAKPRIEQLMSIMGYEFLRTDVIRWRGISPMMRGTRISVRCDGKRHFQLRKPHSRCES